MTDRQLDAMIDSQLLQYEMFIETSVETEMAEIEEEMQAHRYYSESYSY